MRIVLGEDDYVGAWVKYKMPGEYPDFGKFVALGVADGDTLICGIIYRNYYGHDITLDIAATDPRWCQRKVLQAIFAYPFIQLGCARVTGIQPASNERAHRLVEGLGFTREGVHVCGWSATEDSWSYRMLRTECRWIRRIDGKIVTKAAKAA